MLFSVLKLDVLGLVRVRSCWLSLVVLYCADLSGFVALLIVGLFVYFGRLCCVASVGLLVCGCVPWFSCLHCFVILVALMTVCLVIYLLDSLLFTLSLTVDY